MPPRKPDPADPGPVPGDETKRQRYAVLPLSDASRELIKWTAEHCRESQAHVLNAIVAAEVGGQNLLAGLIEGLCRRLATDYDNDRAKERDAKFGKAAPETGGGLDPSGGKEA